MNQDRNIIMTLSALQHTENCSQEPRGELVIKEKHKRFMQFGHLSHHHSLNANLKSLGNNMQISLYIKQMGIFILLGAVLHDMF